MLAATAMQFPLCCQGPLTYSYPSKGQQFRKDWVVYCSTAAKQVEHKADKQSTNHLLLTSYKFFRQQRFRSLLIAERLQRYLFPIRIVRSKHFPMNPSKQRWQLI